MKTIAFVFAVIMASVSALPNLHVESAIRSGQGRLVTDAIASAIEGISQAIIDMGLDPLVIDHEELDYELPVPTIFNMRGHLTGLLFRGASNIVINQMNINVITLRITFNLGLPEILANIVSSELDANLFGKNYHTHFSGRIVIQDIVATGNIRINIGILSGISIREIALTFKLGGIDSQLNLRLQGVDYSDAVNTALGHTIPNTLSAFERDINDLITIVGKDIIESML